MKIFESLGKIATTRATQMGFQTFREGLFPDERLRARGRFRELDKDKLIHVVNLSQPGSWRSFDNELPRQMEGAYHYELASICWKICSCSNMF